MPLAKLCALVTMQRMAGPNVQSFSLPMKLVTQEVRHGRCMVSQRREKVDISKGGKEGAGEEQALV